MRKVKINTRCVADQYAGRNEKIIEFSDEQGNGGLISFVTDSDGITVDLYRHGPRVQVRVGVGEQNPPLDKPHTH